jgi:hypothetical protein
MVVSDDNDLTFADSISAVDESNGRAVSMDEFRFGGRRPIRSCLGSLTLRPSC